MKTKITLVVFCFLSMITAVSAQEKRNYEIGINASYGFSLINSGFNHVGFDLYGGFKPTDHIAFGAGINYSLFQSHILPSGIEAVFVQTDNYHSIRPYIYGKFDFTPYKKWSPYAGVKIGYSAFLNSNYNFHLLAGYDFGTTVDPDDYAYLKDIDHSLNISGSLYSSLDLGISRKISQKGSKLSFGISLEIQPVNFHYFDRNESRTSITVGPFVGFSL